MADILNDFGIESPYYISTTFYEVSNTLLGLILWNLGTKEGNMDESQILNESGTVRVASWDNDAELQARIWMQFRKG